MTLEDFKDYIEDMKRAGFTDEKEWIQLVDRAKEIASKQGKSNDRQVVLGLLQSFFKKKGPTK